jgi:hypothetical protein
MLLEELHCLKKLRRICIAWSHFSLIDLPFSFLQSTSMNMPRAHSDPSVRRLPSIWRPMEPPRPRNVVLRGIPSVSSRRGASSSSSASDFGWGIIPNIQDAQTQTPSIFLAPDTSSSRRSKGRRCWFTKIVMAPCDFLAWILGKCTAPSDNLVRGVQVVYSIVLIVGGIIAIVTALLPYM